MQYLSVMVLAAEEEESSGIALVLPDPVELIAGIIAFAIVFFFIWKWAWPVINKTLEQRQAAMVGQMEEAEKAKGDAESLLADYQAQLAESKAEAPLGLGFLGMRVDRPQQTNQVIQRGMSGYLLPFEIISVHLLIVLVGAAGALLLVRRGARGMM